MGKPSITPGKSVAESDRAWADNIGLLAQHTNVFCKVSGVITEVAGPWVPDDIEAYVSFVITDYGWGRVIYGSDWCASKLASSWYQTLKALPIISSSFVEPKNKLFKTNAEAVYGV
ncbi:hypothetical protein DIPPA_32143 [Diplonema papillatum]|nr:hypothetical protein DIPPA_32143 [Diplonema papillatum]